MISSGLVSVSSFHKLEDDVDYRGQSSSDISDSQFWSVFCQTRGGVHDR